MDCGAERVAALAFAFATVSVDGGVNTTEWNDVDPYSPSDGLYYRVNVGLKSVKPSLKTLISIGGADSTTTFSSVMADVSTRTALVDNLVAFCNGHGFDGVDLDW